jgi:hypothetical protein
MARIINKYLAVAVAMPKQVEDLSQKIKDLTLRAEGMEKLVIQDQIDEVTITNLAERALERAEQSIVDALDFKKVADIKLNQIDLDQKAQNERLVTHDKTLKDVDAEQVKQKERLSTHDKTLQNIDSEQVKQNERLSTHDKTLQDVDAEQVKQNDLLVKYGQSLNQIDMDQKAQNIRLDDHDLDLKQAEENFGEFKNKGILDKG